MDLPPNFDVLVSPPTAYCVVSAAHRYELPPEALLVLAMREAGRPGTVSKAAGGSHDLGIMQVNTLWLGERSKIAPYVSRDALTNDTCTNVHAAAWILASNVRKTAGDVWKAIGMYHHPSDQARADDYKVKVNHWLPLAKQVVQTTPVYQNMIRTFFGSP